MSNKSADRRARVAQLQREQRRAEVRRSFIIVGSAAVVGVVIVAAATFAVVKAQQEKEDLAAAAADPIDGAKEYEDLSRNHVDTGVSYPQNPPVGGDHASVWMNCGAYDEPVVPDQAVHSLEHGAAWISYRPDLAASQVDTLTTLAESNDYVLLSPVEGIDSAVVLTAWGVQLAVDSADDPRVATFVEKYQQGPQTPEPGAACTGGAGGM